MTPHVKWRPRAPRRLVRRVAGASLAVLALSGATPPSVPAAAAAPAQAEQPRDVYALVVHPSTRVSDVSLAEARRIFLGDRQFWPDGGRVVLFVHAPGTAARAVALRHLYQMGEGEFKRYWIAKTFRGDVAAGPKIVSGDDLAKRLTASIPGAVALVPASAVDATVKVVAVNGHLPAAADYPLAASAR